MHGRYSTAELRQYSGMLREGIVERAGEPPAVCVPLLGDGTPTSNNSPSEGMQRSEKTVALGWRWVSQAQVASETALQYAALRCAALHYGTLHYAALRCPALHYAALHHAACPVLEKLYEHCTTLPCPVVAVDYEHCATLPSPAAAAGVGKLATFRQSSSSCRIGISLVSDKLVLRVRTYISKT